MISFGPFPGLLAYSLQLGVIAVLAAFLHALAPLQNARARYLFWTVAALIAGLSPFVSVGPSSPLSSMVGEALFRVEAAADAVPPAGRSALIWGLFGGGLWAVARRVAGLAWLRRARRAARPLPPEEIYAGADRLQVELGASAEYRVSAEVEGPLTYGVVRHAVLLPRRFFDLSAAQRRTVLAHELIHVRRRDWLRQLVEEGARCMLWFHPGAHALINRIQSARESCVDARVVAETGDQESYLDAMLEMARAASPAPTQAAALFGGRSDLKDRIQLLVKERPMSKARMFFSLAVMLGVLVLGGVWSARAAPQAPAQGGEIHKVGGDVKAPRLLTKVEPDYSEEAREANLSGTIKLAIVVRTDGRAHNIEIVEGLGMGLDEKAREAIEQWEFEPGTKNGAAVDVAARVEMNFRLRDK